MNYLYALLSFIVFGILTFAMMGCTQILKPISYKPEFKIGDCLLDNKYEKWETNHIVKIVEIGELNYHILVWDAWSENFIDLQDSLGFSYNLNYKTVECLK